MYKNHSWKYCGNRRVGLNIKHLCFYVFDSKVHVTPKIIGKTSTRQSHKEHLEKMPANQTLSLRKIKHDDLHNEFNVKNAITNWND